MSIFEKQAMLKPSAMATVAERRFDDAVALCETNDNARANGAAYIAGFVIEILLKARLVAKYREIARKRQHEVTGCRTVNLAIDLETARPGRNARTTPRA